MKKVIIPGLVAPFMAACATVGPAETAGVMCNDAQLQQFVGQAATADLGARIRSTSGAKTLQWVANGSMVTMDFRGDRVRVYLDAQNKVERLSCG